MFPCETKHHKILEYHKLFFFCNKVNVMCAKHWYNHQSILQIKNISDICTFLEMCQDPNIETPLQMQLQ